MKIDPFKVEIWMNAHETACRYNLAETCVDSLTLGELAALTGGLELETLTNVKLTYGAIEGSARLRAAIAALYTSRTPEEVLVTHGAIGANALAYAALVDPGDEVVAITPAYQQHVSIPRSLGAEVKELRLRAEDGYLPDLGALSALMTPKTRLISLTNPNNPTGSVIDPAGLEGIVKIAAAHGAMVLCDEVYRGVDQASDGLGPSIADLYDQGVAIGGMSKAFALAGLRLGWIIAPPQVREQVMIHRDYTTISVGMIDDHLAAVALERREAILARNRAIVRANLPLLDAFVAETPQVRWVRPAGGNVALLDYGRPIPSEILCRRLLEDTGVLVVPGSCFDMEGTIRVGFGNPMSALKPGLQALSAFLQHLPG